jgi:hypothetical protein
MSSTGWEVNEGAWRKSRRSATNGECVEVAAFGCDEVAVRDTKSRSGPVLRYKASDWRNFVELAKKDGYGLNVPQLNAIYR